MFQTLSYQLYTATEQQPPAGLPAAEFAAGLRDLRLRLRRAGLVRRVRNVRPAADAITASGSTAPAGVPSGAR